MDRSGAELFRCNTTVTGVALMHLMLSSKAVSTFSLHRLSYRFQSTVTSTDAKVLGTGLLAGYVGSLMGLGGAFIAIPLLSG